MSEKEILDRLEAMRDEVGDILQDIMALAPKRLATTSLYHLEEIVKGASNARGALHHMRVQVGTVMAGVE